MRYYDRSGWNLRIWLVSLIMRGSHWVMGGWKSLKRGIGWKSEYKHHGEAASSTPEAVEQERKWIRELITKYGYELKDIFNMDETGLFYGYIHFLLSILMLSWLTVCCRMVPDRGLVNKQYSGVKGKKIWLTYALTTNADGSEKLPPIMIGKAYRPWAFNKKTGEQLGFYYWNNAKAWMTSSLYEEWIKQWDRELTQRQWWILLLQDRFRVLSIENEVIIQLFNPVPITDFRVRFLLGLWEMPALLLQALLSTHILLISCEKAHVDLYQFIPLELVSLSLYCLTAIFLFFHRKNVLHLPSSIICPHAIHAGHGGYTCPSKPLGDFNPQIHYNNVCVSHSHGITVGMLLL